MYSVDSSFFNPFSIELSRSRKDYSFITSKMRHGIHNLLNKNDYMRLLSSNIDEIYKMLEDKSYIITQEKSPDLVMSQIESEFKKELKVLLRGAEQLSPSSTTKFPLEELLFGSFDFNNFKILSKGLLKELTFDELKIQGQGFLPTQDLEKLYQDKEIGFLPSCIKEALAHYKRKGSIKEPKEIDLAWDFLFHQFYHKRVKTLSSNFVSRLYKLQVDTKNILTMFRLKAIGQDFTSFKSFFVPEGSIRLFDFKNMYLQSIEELQGSFKSLGYDSYIQKGLEHYKVHKSLSDLEKSLEEYILSCVFRTQKLLEGPDLILAYFLLKKSEISNINILLVSSFNKIDKDWAISKMRLAYV